MKGQFGFTLTELLVVIAIIGVLTAMVMFAFNNGTHINDLRRVSTELVQGLRQAQQYTIGGSSLWYCTSDPPNLHFGESCQQNVDAPCQVDGVGSCKNGVPQGGYAVTINSTTDYTVFGDTDYVVTGGIVQGGYLSDPDYVVINNYISSKGVHINFFKLSDQAQYQTPSADNYVVVRFSPPEGTVHIYQVLRGQPGTEAYSADLEIVIGSSFLPNNCRKITINHISGQISEANSVCP